ncbi:MAG: hypothetical protein DHS20C13_24950 [Thermodesulfobacteriota bacterium]|nr:MAG: hypothetical protein DHS20C13_24950 [Thermodesulfobacteriota bacterium]
MVGVISSNDISQDKTSAPLKTTKSKSISDETSKPKLVLEKEPVKQSIQNQNKTKDQKPILETVRAENKSSSKPKQVSSSNIKPDNNPTKETASTTLNNSGKPYVGQDKASGTAGYSTELAYPNYNINPKPKYPRTARKRGYEGEVKLKVFVLENGKVGRIEITSPSGYEILDQSALEAVKNWVFVPGKENGREISSWVTIPITFQLKSS